MSKKTVLEELRRQIYSGVLVPGIRLPSERALANQFNVSRGTIQSAVRDLESQGLVSRERNCCPVVAVPQFESGLHQAIAANQVAVWMMADRQDLGGTMILHGIQATLGVEGYRLLLGCATGGDLADVHGEESRFLESIIGNPSVAGALIWYTGNPDAERLYNKLLSAGLPLVFVDREPPINVKADLVAINGRRAARNLVRNLLELGHRRIAVVVGEERVSSVEDRLDGYRAALADFGLSRECESIVDFGASTSNAVADATELLLRLMGRTDPPTAVVAINDRIALTLMDAARSLGIAVPGQLSVAGFDWLMRWLPTGGDLTTVAQPFHEIGAAAAQRLVAKILSPAAEPPAHILLDGSVVMRRSTGQFVGPAFFGTNRATP